MRQSYLNSERNSAVSQKPSRTIRLLLMVLFVSLLTNFSFGQTIIAKQDFEASPATPVLAYTNSSGTVGTNTPGFPAGATTVYTGLKGYYKTSGSATFTSNANIDTRCYSSPSLTFNLAALSTSSTNGMDTPDVVTISISTDGGATFSDEMKITGNNNAAWSYTSGTGSATSAYDGNGTIESAKTFTPSNVVGAHTTDGYSTVTLSGLPNISSLRIKITLVNNSNTETWAIDNVVISNANAAIIAPASTTLVTASPASICSGSSSNLNATSAGNTINWWTATIGGTLVGTSVSGVNFSVSPNSNTTYYAEAQSSYGCVSSRTSVSLTVNSLPTITGPLNVCMGSSITLTGSATPNTTAAWTSATPAVATINSLGVVTPVSAGTSIITYKNTNGCTVNSIVTVNDLPVVAPIAGGSSTVCVNSSTPVFTDTTGSGVWSITSGTGTASITSGVVTGLTAGTVTVNYSVTTSGCTTTAIKDLAVNALPTTPTITAGGPTTFCYGGSVALTSSAANGNVWSTGETTQSIIVSASGTYTVQLTNANGCQSSASTVVTVNSIPSTPSVAANSTSICNGSSTTIKGTSTGNTIYWYTQSTDGVSFGNSSSGSAISVSPTNTTIYYAEAQSASGCVSASRSPTTITVNPQPTASAGGTQTICQNGTATVSGAAASNGTIAWTENGAGTLSGANTLTPTYTAAAGDAGKTVTLIMKVSNGSCSATAQYSITVYPSPTVAAITGTKGVCVGSATTLASATTGGTWSSSDLTVASVDSNTGVVTGVAGGSATITYSSAPNNNGCMGTQTTNFTVYQPVAVQIEITQGQNDKNIPGGISASSCSSVDNVQNDLDIYSGNPADPSGKSQPSTFGASGAIGLWQVSYDNGTTWNTAPGASNNTTQYSLNGIPFVSSVGNYLFRLIITNYGCSVTSDNITITVNASTSATMGSIATTDTTPFCGSGDPAAFTATAPTLSSRTYTYQWQSSTDNFTYTNLAGATSATYDPVTITQTTYFRRNVIITSGGCVNSGDPIVLTVNALPVTTGVSICAGGSGSLTTSVVCSDLIVVTALTNAGTGTGTNWYNATYINAADGSNATITVSRGNTSNVLNATKYGFNIPLTAIINGVQVTVGRSASSTSSLKDNSVKLIVNGSSIGNNNADTSTSWPNSITAANYGSSSDLWGVMLTPAIINDKTFGASLSIDNSNNTSKIASVDYMQITVTYTLPGNVNWYTASGALVGSGSSFNPVGVSGSGLVDTNTPGSTTYYVACSSNPTCKSPATFVITSPVVTFTSQPGATAYANTDVTYTTQSGQSNYVWGVPGTLNTDYSITSGGIGTSSNTITLKWLTTGNKTVTINYNNATGCSAANATSSSVTAVSASLLPAPTVTTTQPTCATPTGTITVTAVSGMSYSIDGTAYTNATSFPSLVPNSYNVTAKETSSGKVSNITPVIIKPLVTNTFTTTWDNNTPNIDQNIIFDGDFNVSTDITACSCTVNPGRNVVVSPSNTLTITNQVTVLGSGTLTFNSTASDNSSNPISNSGSLVQTNDTPLVANSGAITYNRTVPAIHNTDYTYWSSPVSSESLASFSPLTPTDKIYSYNAIGDFWANERATNPMLQGTGYCIYGPQNANNSNFYASFTGVPNNGPVSITGVGVNQSLLIGNPYPSAIDADLFITANLGVIDGSLYFWTHNTDPVNGQYTYNDYATYNLTGGTGTTKANKGVKAPSASGSTNAFINANSPNGFITSGQGFFVGSNATSITDTKIIFNNSMRIAGSIAGVNNSQFFKTTVNTKAKNANAIEKDRVWLNLTNDQGVFKQTLVGYISGATNDYDTAYDADTYDSLDAADFYSVNQDSNLVIQGRALPFDENDTVPLGFRSSSDGDFTINIDQVDGLLANQSVFVEDKLTNTVTDLKNGDYKFSTLAGTFNDRLVLKYTNTSKTLSVVTDQVDGIMVFYSSNYKTLIIHNSAADTTVNSVVLYNIAGQNISNWQVKDYDQTNIQIPIKEISSGIYIVKVNTSKGESNKKIIVN